MPARILLVGARSRRQGTGPFIAAGLDQAGAELCAVVGTREETVAEARESLKRDLGIRCGGYTDLAAALEKERPDAVALCSPWRYHMEQLVLIALASCHCLVEKPLAWPLSADAADELIGLFEGQGLLLQMVNQWPTTLGAFTELHGDLPAPVKQFSMRLSPISIGPDMITDSAPHFIGQLQALAGPGECQDSRIERISKEELRAHCRYRHAGGTIDATLILKTQQQRPRPAWYQINGLRVDRAVELPDYRQYLVAGDRRIELADPMHQVTSNFLQALAESQASPADNLKAAHRNLLQLAQAWDQ